MIRGSALRTSVARILSAPLEKEDETKALRFGSELVNRVNVIGTVVSFQPDENMLMLDDGTGTIAVQWFEGSQVVSVGDLVLLIGRVREFNERYVFPEILRRIDTKWLEVRKKELERMPEPTPVAQASVNTNVTPTNEAGDDPEERALKLIHELDRGDGADMDEVMTKLGESGDEIIKRLLMAGEIFEAKPGRLRLL